MSSEMMTRMPSMTQDEAMDRAAAFDTAARAVQLPVALQAFGKAIVASLAGGRHSVPGADGQTAAVVERRDSGVAIMAPKRTLSRIEWRKLRDFSELLEVELQPIEL